MLIKEPAVTQDFLNGIMEGKDVKSYSKHLSSMKDYYKEVSQEDLKKDPIVYTVYSYTKGDETLLGNLMWGLTVMEPILVNGECNLTRGHFHANRDCAEMYFGLYGEGLLLFMDETGYTWAEKVFPGSIHHIEGTIAHRLVNTGDTVFKVGECWPNMAGHDYEAIEKHDFAYRVLKINGEVIFEKR